MTEKKNCGIRFFFKKKVTDMANFRHISKFKRLTKILLWHTIFKILQFYALLLITIKYYTLSLIKLKSL